MMRTHSHSVLSSLKHLNCPNIVRLFSANTKRNKYWFCDVSACWCAQANGPSETKINEMMYSFQLALGREALTLGLKRRNIDYSRKASKKYMNSIEPSYICAKPILRTFSESRCSLPPYVFRETRLAKCSFLFTLQNLLASNRYI